MKHATYLETHAIKLAYPKVAGIHVLLHEDGGPYGPGGVVSRNVKEHLELEILEEIVDHDEGRLERVVVHEELYMAAWG